jgi:hypothetical protein
MTWTERTLRCKPYQPHCHAWAPAGDIIYAGCVGGEVLSFEVGGPLSKLGSPEALGAADGKLLITVDKPEKIVGLCIGENHMVVVGISGSCYWLGFPVRVVKEKPVEVTTGRRKARPKKGEPAVEEPIEYELIVPNYHIAQRLHLSLMSVTNAQYRQDEEQLLLGSSNGSITTVKVDVGHLRDQLTARPGDVLEKVDNVVHIEWQSNFHSGPITAMGMLRLVRVTFHL